jgi:Mn-dependent DtxR family transcriptional regulator
MCSRFVELVALGPELRSLAERRGEGVNEALFLVHEVLEEAFLDLAGLPSEGLREHLSSRLEHRLDTRADSPAREPHMSPVLWKFAASRSAPRRAVTAPAR